MAEAQHYDVIWIGTGQATMTVVPRLVSAGRNVAVVEGGAFGGTCVNHGCTPTKTLVASAYAVQLARRGKDFGFSVDDLKVDFAKVMQTQQVNRQSSSQGIEASLRKLATVYQGYAAFKDDKTVQVNEDLLTAETIVIHAGTSPTTPDVPGIDEIQWLNNRSLLDLTELPKHLVVVGGSYIALEFAQIFRRLGSEVTVLERGPRLVFREDEDVAQIVQGLLAAEGIRIECNASVQSVSKADEGVHLQYERSGQTSSLNASHILFATGRIPNSESLNPAAAGLQLSTRGHIEVNEVTQTNVPHIYALGDINGRGAFTHTSVNDGEVFWDHYAREHGLSDEPPELDRKLSGRKMVYAMFIDPPLARVGMSETQARQSERNVMMAVAPMSRIARAREKRETNGLVKILVDADTEELLGATVFGTGGDEVIGAFAVHMHAGLSWKQFRRVVFPHPTVSELMPWIMDGLKPLE